MRVFSFWWRFANGKAVAAAGIEREGNVRRFCFTHPFPPKVRNCASINLEDIRLDVLFYNLT